MVRFDTERDGLRTMLKEYQEVALRYLWSLGEGVEASNFDIWVNVNNLMRVDPSDRDSISRASIINFMKSMENEGAVDYTEITGKGGRRRKYSMKFDETGFKKFIANKIRAKLREILKTQD